VIQRPFDERRPLKEWAFLRDIKVYVDGHKVSGLRPKQYISIELPDGSHTVRGRMDWVTCKPMEVIVTAEKPTFIELSMPFTSVIKWFILPTRAVKARLVEGGPEGKPSDSPEP
jgi:hypothetical protein